MRNFRSECDKLPQPISQIPCNKRVLTGQVWHRLQLLLPVLGDLDRLVLHGFAFRRHPLLVGVDHEVLEILRMNRVQDVEEIGAGWPFIGWKLVREVLHEQLVILEHGEECLDGELIIVWHLDVRDRSLLEQHLLAGQDVLEEVLGHGAFIGQIVLD